MSNVRETMEYKRMEYFEIADNESIYPLKILRETIKVERLSLTLSPCGATQTHAWAHTHTHTHRGRPRQAMWRAGTSCYFPLHITMG